MKQTVADLHQRLWALFYAFRGRIAVSDYRDVVLAALALKAATDREPYGFATVRSDMEVMPSAGRRSKRPPRSDRKLVEEFARPRRRAAALLVPGARGTIESFEPADEDAPSRDTWSRLTDLRNESVIKGVTRIRRHVEKHEPTLRGALDALDGLLESTSADLRPALASLARVDLDPASFEVPWAFGAVVDRLILDFARLDRARGEYCSSPGVASLMASLVSVTPGLSVHDPASGSGRLLAECAKHLVSTGQDPTSLSLSGTELNQRTWSLGRINLWSCGLDASNVQLGPAFAGGESMQFDRVVCDPPFGSHVQLTEAEAQSLGLEHGRVRIEDAFLMRAVGLLKPSGRAVVLVPQGSLFRQDRTTASIRRKLVDERLLRAVVQLPAGLLFGTVIPTSILVIGRDSRLGEAVRFIDASNAGWETETGRLPVAATEAVRMAITGGHTNLPARFVTPEELAKAEYTLAANRFITPYSIHSPPTSVLRDSTIQWLAGEERPTNSAEHVLTDEQDKALESITVALTNGGVANLVGAKRSGKTTLLQHIARRFSADATVVQIQLGALQRGFFASQLRERLRSVETQRGRLIVIFDDWEIAGDVIADDEIEDFQRLLGGVIDRGWGSAVVFASSESVVALENAWQREIVPRSVQGQIRTISIGAAAAWPKWNALIRKLRNRLAHDKSINWFEMENELRHAPLLHDLQERLRVAPRGASSEMTRLLDQFLDAPKWERFLAELAEAHPWVREECRVQGFDLDRDRGQLLGFLARMNLAPVQFASELFRPSDLARLFPESGGPRDKVTSLSEAFEEWRRARDAGENASGREGTEEDEHVVTRRT